MSSISAQSGFRAHASTNTTEMPHAEASDLASRHVKGLRLAALLASLTLVTFLTFLDASIIGGPPSDPSNPPTEGSKPYTPTFYASAVKEDEGKLDEFVRVLEGRGLRAVALKGEGVGVGDASALKMSYAVSLASILLLSLSLHVHAMVRTTSLWC